MAVRDAGDRLNDKLNLRSGASIAHAGRGGPSAADLRWCCARRPRPRPRPPASGRGGGKRLLRVRRFCCVLSGRDSGGGAAGATVQLRRRRLGQQPARRASPPRESGRDAGWPDSESPGSAVEPGLGRSLHSGRAGPCADPPPAPHCNAALRRAGRWARRASAAALAPLRRCGGGPQSTVRRAAPRPGSAAMPRSASCTADIHCSCNHCPTGRGRAAQF
jgi:hypothetical protein